MLTFLLAEILTSKFLRFNLKPVFEQKTICTVHAQTEMLFFFTFTDYGYWGKWGQWSKCDRSCNSPRQRRTRYCEFKKGVTGPYNNVMCNGGKENYGYKPCKYVGICDSKFL